MTFYPVHITLESSKGHLLAGITTLGTSGPLYWSWLSSETAASCKGSGGAIRDERHGYSLAGSVPRREGRAA